jgi:hypothetical protein
VALIPSWNEQPFAQAADVSAASNAATARIRKNLFSIGLTSRERRKERVRLLSKAMRATAYHLKYDAIFACVKGPRSLND